ncbi:MAG: hypothetical protein MUP55_00665, partial [Candidatus Aenigmarchaeota archaeon]|nr:hypothetical protein [Candidatus Aenigmarchaeota archaeon]
GEEVQKNQALLQYDTYWEESSGAHGYYELPKKDKLLHLIFVGEKEIPFCTLRRHTPEKEKYYKELIGHNFRVVIKEPEPIAECQIRTKPCPQSHLLWEHFCITHACLWVSYSGHPKTCCENGNKDFTTIPKVTS